MAGPITALLAGAKWAGRAFAGEQAAEARVKGALINILGTNIQGALARSQNRAIPNQPPGPEELFKLKWMGALTYNQTRDLLFSHGISLGGANADGRWGQIWETWEEHNRPIYSLDTAVQLRRLGNMPESVFNEVLDRHGVTYTRWRNYYKQTLATEPLPLEITLYLWWSNLLDEVTTRTYLTRLGYAARGDQDTLMANPVGPATGDALQLLNRGLIGADRADAYLRRGGLPSQEARDEVAKLRFAMPTIGEILGMAVRKIWDPRVVQRYAYDDEFPPQLKYWAEKMGYDWTAEGVGGAAPPAGHVPWPVAWWRSAKELMPLSQAYDAYRRLRPGRERRFRDDWPDILPFTKDDLDFHLKVVNYPSPVRDWLAAVSATPIRLFEIRNGLKTGVKDAAWAVEQMRDRGLITEDAVATVDIWQAQQRQAKLDKAAAEYAKQVYHAYEVSAITKTDATNALTTAGLDRVEISIRLGALDLKTSAEQYKGMLTALRRAFLGGEMSAVELSQGLTAAQVQPARVQYYVTSWTYQLTYRRKAASTANIIQWYSEGLLSEAVAMARLANLGWVTPNLNLLLASANLQIAKEQARLVEASSRAQTKRAKELEQIIRDGQSRTSDLQAELRRQTPMASLKKWLRAKTIGLDVFTRRARAQGYPDPVIEGYAVEAGALGVNGTAIDLDTATAETSAEESGEV